MKRLLDRGLANYVSLAVVSALMTLILFTFPFNALEARLYDLRMRWTIAGSGDPRIVLIAIDPVSANEIDEFSPFTLPVHLEFLNRLASLKPKGIGYLVNLHAVHENGPEHFQGQTAIRFIETVRAMGRLGIPVLFATQFDVNGEVLPPYPLATLPHAISILHRDGNQFAEDKITRQALVDISGRPAFHLELARQTGLISPDTPVRGAFSSSQIEGRYMQFRFPGKPSNMAPYPLYSFSDVMKDRIPRENIQDKILLVAPLFRDNFDDFALTPLYGQEKPRPRLEVHADILTSLARNDGVIRPPFAVEWCLTFLLIFFVAARVLHTSPITGLLSTLGLAGAILILGWVLFQDWWGIGGIWLKLAHPLVGTLLAYYLVVPYCLVREHEGRWELERQTELMKQVEDLKTHFLFLVTHDLKTPVARIQGLVEMLRRKAANRFVDRDLETLQQIQDSTEELNHFITSILELHSVESNRLRPSFESKDLNQLVERTIEGHKAQAKARRIRIEPKLEPLFPVKLDPNLIAKVLNNLLSNALQYSPEGSTIHVYSREVGSKVEVTVKDEGFGMTEEEISQLFTRFYRAKNEHTTRTRGTGLGLYLTKFFVEAHSGRVDVESEPGRGSAFTISLPLDPPELKGLPGA